MDKETLSNYGWVVICVLVLVVMIALATPFGRFIANAVKNTTQALFSSTKNRLDTVLEDTGVSVEAPDDFVILDANGGGSGGGDQGGSGGSTGGEQGGSGGSSTTQTAQELADASALVTGTIAKGETIKIDNKDYLVMKVNGTEVMVLAKYNAKSSQRFHGSSNAYFTSDVDTYLTGTFQTSLNSAVQNALVEQTITQNKYTWNSSVYNADTHASYADMSTKTAVTSGTRKVFLLDVADIEEYFGGTYSTTDVENMFESSGWYWLRSAIADSSNGAFYVIGDSGYLRTGNVSGNGAVRPAFVLDLSKL